MTESFRVRTAFCARQLSLILAFRVQRHRGERHPRRQYVGQRHWFEFDLRLYVTLGTVLARLVR
jgi:hypothetical protein